MEQLKYFITVYIMTITNNQFLSNTGNIPKVMMTVTIVGLHITQFWTSTPLPFRCILNTIAKLNLEHYTNRIMFYYTKPDPAVSPIVANSLRDIGSFFTAKGHHVTL